MLAGLRKFLFGARLPPAAEDGIPQPAREAHHKLRNTAMRMRMTARSIEHDANDLLETLARDIRDAGRRRR